MHLSTKVKQAADRVRVNKFERDAAGSNSEAPSGAFADQGLPAFCRKPFTGERRGPSGAAAPLRDRQGQILCLLCFLQTERRLPGHPCLERKKSRDETLSLTRKLTIL